MNDIEVLEDYINRYDIQDLDNEGIEFKNALENLLKERQSDKERIKDLEEINEAHKKREWRIKRRTRKCKRNILYTKRDRNKLHSKIFNKRKDRRIKRKSR